MTISKLASGTKFSPNCSKPRNQKICKFTPHYMAGNLTASQCGDIFLPTSREASSNYGIGSDGEIFCYVAEENRAWTSSSSWNDNQAITVEVANLDNETGRISDKAWQSLVRLATDICHRYNFRLNFTNDRYGSLTMHKMFSATACPGPWLESHMKELASTVNKNLDTGNFAYSGVASGLATLDGGIVVIDDPATAYAIGINANFLFAQEDIYPFMITIDSKSPELDFNLLKDQDVVGVCIEAGSYFSPSHTVNEVFRSPSLDLQVSACKKAKMPFALKFEIQARNEDEAYQESYQIRLAARKYPPQLGLWLVPKFTSNSKSTNDKILNIFYSSFVKAGFYDQVGLYCKKELLEKITWDKHKDNWYWWMDRHLKSVDTIHNLPTPKFFAYDDPADEDGLIEPDFESAELALANAFYGTSGGYTDVQELVSKTAETSNNLTTASGWCAQFVTDVFAQARLKNSSIQVPYGNAIDYWTKWKSSGSTDKNAPVGSVVVGSGWAYYNDGTNPFGHVGVVLTDGRVADNVGYRRISSSVDAWASGQNAPCGSYRGYIGWVWACGQDLSKMGTMIGGFTNANSANGITVPAGLGTYATFEKGNINWAAGTNQRKFWNLTSKISVDSNGFYRCENRYVIAMRPKFGTSGDRVNVYFRNGKMLQGILGDIKGSDANSEWGHDSGRNMVEFIVRSDHVAGDSGVTWYGNVGRAQSWLHSWWNNQGFDSGVAKVSNLGSIF